MKASSQNKCHAAGDCDNISPQRQYHIHISYMLYRYFHQDLASLSLLEPLVLFSCGLLVLGWHRRGGGCCADGGCWGRLSCERGGRAERHLDGVLTQECGLDLQAVRRAGTAVLSAGGCIRVVDDSSGGLVGAAADAAAAQDGGGHPEDKLAQAAEAQHPIQGLVDAGAIWFKEEFGN